MQWLLQWRSQAQPPVPAFADAVVQLTTFAVGDGASALALARVALHRAPSLGYAISKLEKLLPAYWLSWPSVGPREWLELDLRASDAERLVAVLGEWSPHDRLLLGLWLLLDVPLEELEQWLHFPEAAARVLTLLRHVARTLGWDEPVARPPSCVAVMDTLIEADDKQVDRRTRLHLLGCLACQEERAALQKARSIILHAWQLMFRAPRYSGPTVAQTPAQRERSQWIMRRTGALALCFVLGFAAAHSGGQTPASAEVPALTMTAPAVIEQALHRWEQRPHFGIAHERYRVLSGTKTIVIERWYAWAEPHRLRVLVHESTGALLLDLITDGQRHLTYHIEVPPVKERKVSVDDADVADLLPLLRQLPMVGPLRSFPADLRNSDLALLWAAQQHTARLLGTSRVGGRLASHLLFTDTHNVTIHLLIDQQTAAVLQATRLDPEVGQGQLVWKADLIETLATAAELYDTVDTN